eukprot:snap_masked-scaffold_10-processed-gene-9.33-mRNA-1 protein AED:1.00 eAED:1.00 QI:0/0/0/0/1/1/2/0/76
MQQSFGKYASSSLTRVWCVSSKFDKLNNYKKLFIFFKTKSQVIFSDIKIQFIAVLNVEIDIYIAEEEKKTFSMFNK